MVIKSVAGASLEAFRAIFSHFQKVQRKTPAPTQICPRFWLSGWLGDKDPSQCKNGRENIGPKALEA
eukprot:1158638-Pelagomonas_calceolata.AAC.5